MSRTTAASVKGGFTSVSGGRPLKLTQAREPIKSKRAGRRPHGTLLKTRPVMGARLSKLYFKHAAQLAQLLIAAE
jgi:hypothetical protein